MKMKLNTEIAKIIIETKTVLFYLLLYVYAGLQSQRSQEKHPKHFQNCKRFANIFKRFATHSRL